MPKPEAGTDDARWPPRWPLPGGPHPATRTRWQDTRVLKTLWPAQAGTRRLSARFGAALVCVRYRQDPAPGGLRYTTVELLLASRHAARRLNPSVVYAVGVHWRERDLIRQLRDSGAHWNRALGKWHATGRTLTALKLTHRIRER